MSLSIDVFNSQNMYKCEKLYTKKENFGIYFQSSISHLILHLESRVAVDDIHLEGTV